METLHDTKQTSEMLNISEGTVRQWIHFKRLPIVRLGRRVMVKKSTIEKILNGGLVAVESEQEET